MISAFPASIQHIVHNRYLAIRGRNEGREEGRVSEIEGEIKGGKNSLFYSQVSKILVSKKKKKRLTFVSNLHCISYIFNLDYFIRHGNFVLSLHR